MITAFRNDVTETWKNYKFGTTELTGLCEAAAGAVLLPVSSFVTAFDWEVPGNSIQTVKSLALMTARGLVKLTIPICIATGYALFNRC